MTNTERILANNAELREAIEMAESLPDAGSGGTTPAEPIIEPLAITENGTYTAPDGVDGYSPVTVNVPIPDGYIQPSGTKTITENGTHDAKTYESVNVNVPIPDGYIKPSGSQEITANGSYDVTDKEGVVVAVPEREIVLQDKEITSNGTYSADDGYDGLGEVNVNVPIPEGYIQPSGTKDITENGTHDVTAYASVNVNVEGSGGGDTTVEDGIVNRSISGAYTNNRVTSVGQFAFRGCTKITSFSFPKATSVGTNAIYGCSKLTSVNMPLVKSIGDNAFNGCSILPSIVLPSLTSGGSYMFRYCYKLLTIDLPVITNIVANMFCDCRSMTAVILRSSTMCTLANTSAFSNCYHFHGTKNSQYNPNGDKDGYIYVPSALIEDYKVATNWSSFASQFRAIEDYPEICGG